MNQFSDVLGFFIFIFVPLCNASPIQAPSGIHIIIGNDNYEINKYNLPYGVNYVVKRLNNDISNSVQYSIHNDHLLDLEFRFDKSLYEVNTSPTIIGIIGRFSVQTNATGCLVFGLASDDVYINKVFRVGPDSGLLYADSHIKAGVYNFNVTADITDKQLHAEAKVVVNVKTKKSSDVDLSDTNLKFKLSGVRTDALSKSTTTKQETPKEVEVDAGGDVNTNEVTRPSSQELWNRILRERFSSGAQYSHVKALLEPNQSPVEKERESVFLQHDPINSRRKRAVPPSNVPTRPSSVVYAQNIPTVQSKRIYPESPIAETIMSAFVILVVSSGTVLLFGSIFYFAYKRIKKCGDYAIDEDAKSTTKPVDDETVYATIQSELKNPNLLSISDQLKQSRVVDSIEITKQKLSNGPSVFTIQKSYEEEYSNKMKHKDDEDEMFVMDMQQLSVGPGSEFSKILLKSNSASTPTITATLVDEKENFPQSILSTSRRNSVSSRKDGSSLGSGDFADGQTRRKSVSFSEIVELYQG